MKENLISYRQHIYKDAMEPEKIYQVVTEKECLPYLEDRINELINAEESFSIKSDYRDGVLFDILLERFDPKDE